RLALLEFYDTKPDDSIGHATAINAISGEDLGAGLLKHYLETCTKSDVTLLDEKVTLGTPSGPRLDRWVLVKWADRATLVQVEGPGEGDGLSVLGADGTTLFQVEIKNWSAHGFGGEPLPLNASPAEVAVYKKKEWGRVWNEERRELRVERTHKVLLPMKTS